MTETEAKRHVEVVRMHIHHADGRDEVLSILEGSVLRVGRQNGNELVLADRRVSRFHAIFNATTAGIVLSDLQSLNGTFVNGRRISVPVDLQSGDIVVFGDTSVRIELVFESESSSTRPGDTPTETQSVGMQAVGVTVLVADVVGYTRLAQAFPAEEVARTLDLWFERTTKTVREFGGIVDKFLGDALMAIWRGEVRRPGETKGEQTPLSELAGQAARAALQLQQDTASMNTPALWPHFLDHPWQCRISLNSGEALMGALGSRAMREFTVLGDTVNVAFRLNDVAKQLGSKIVVSGNTAEYLRGVLPVVPLGQVELEGRIGREDVFSLGG